jgi:hypothetical protein
LEYNIAISASEHIGVYVTRLSINFGSYISIFYKLYSGSLGTTRTAPFLSPESTTDSMSETEKLNSRGDDGDNM